MFTFLGPVQSPLHTCSSSTRNRLIHLDSKLRLLASSIVTGPKSAPGWRDCLPLQVDWTHSTVEKNLPEPLCHPRTGSNKSSSRGHTEQVYLHTTKMLSDLFVFSSGEYLFFKSYTVIWQFMKCILSIAMSLKCFQGHGFRTCVSLPKLISMFSILTTFRYVCYNLCKFVNV